MIFAAWNSPFPSTRSAEIPRIIHYEMESIQAGRQNWSITQGQNGFIYTGNDRGLLEFDGHRWMLRPLPGHHRIRSVASDSMGRIYTGGFGDFGFWSYDSIGQLHFQSLKTKIRSSIFDQEEIWNIVIHPKGVLFQSFSALYLWQGDTVRNLTVPGNIMFIQNIGERFYLPVIRQGLYTLSLNGDLQLVEDSEFLAQFSISAVFEVDGDLCVGTKKNGIFIKKPSSWVPWNSPVNDWLKQFELNKALVLKSGMLALGTIRNGAFLIGTDGSLAYHLKRGKGLQNNTVLAFREDRAHNLWIGLDNGLDLVVLNDPTVYFIDEEGNVGSVYGAARFQNRFYLGTNQGLFVQSFKPEEVPNFELVGNLVGQVWDLHATDYGLLCGNNEGTYLIGSAGNPKLISDVNGGWSFCQVPEKEGCIFQGTYTGISKFILNNGQWEHAGQLANFSFPINKLLYEKDRWFWAQHPIKGLFRIHLSKDWASVDQIQTFSEVNGLPDQFNISITNLEGEIIVWSDEKNLIWDSVKQRLQPVQPDHRFYSPNQILALESGSYLEVLEESILLNQLGNHPFNLPLRLVDGYKVAIPLKQHILFCMDNGYALYPKDREPTEVFVPDLMPRWILSYNGQLQQSPVYMPLSSPHPVRFPRNTGRILFHFATPNFEKEALYRYRVVGLDEQWSPWRSEPFVDLVNLPPGFYHLEVESNLTGQGWQYHFRIPVPWYLSTGAMVLWIILIGGLFVALLRWHRIRLAREKLNQMQKQRKELRRQRLKTQTRQLEFNLEQQSKELVNTAYNLARKNEVLSQVKKQLNKLEKSETQTTTPIRKVIQTIDAHLDDDKDRQLFDQYFNQVHNHFFDRLKHDHPNLTSADLQLAAFLKMNLSTKEIAPLLHISIRGVENRRYRLRKKMNLSPETNLNEYFIQF